MMPTVLCRLHSTPRVDAVDGSLSGFGLAELSGPAKLLRPICIVLTVDKFKANVSPM